MSDMSLLIPECNWTPPDGLPRLRRRPVLAIDTETRDPDLKTKGPGVRRGGYIVGISIAGTDLPGQYYPIRHDGGGNMDTDLILDWLRDELNGYDGEVVGANLLYDLDFLAHEGIHFGKAKFHDIQIAEPLLDENRMTYSLEALCQDYLGISKDETMLKQACAAFGIKDIKGGLWRLPAKYVGAYAEGDVNYPLLILEKQRTELAAQGLTELFEMESALIPMLLAMRRRGVRVDVPAIATTRDQIITMRQVAFDELGTDDIWSAESLAVLFDRAGAEYPRTPKSNKPSFTKPWLTMNTSPVARAVMEARRWDKVVSTFIDGHLATAIDGYIHCQFNQLKSDEAGTISGRFSSCLPGHVRVDTCGGIMPLSKVSVGDFVYTHKNRLRPVLNKLFNGNEKTFRISLFNGKVLECTSNHRLLTSAGWLSLEDIYEREYGKNVGPDFISENCGSIYWGGQADVAGTSDAHGRVVAYSGGDHTAGLASGGAHQGKGTAVREGQDRLAESDGREVSRAASQLQGGDSIEGWLLTDNPTSVVHGAGKIKAHPASSRYYLRGHGPDGNSERLPRTSHRWPTKQQRHRQSGISVASSAQGHSHVFSHIREVEFVGVAPVYDLEIEEDHSFIAGGVFVHNSNPNLQQIPARDPAVTALLRKLFIPEDGDEWLQLDMSQMEYRLLAHIARGPGSAEARQAYIDDPLTDFHNLCGEMAGLPGDENRKKVKGVNFCKIFGGGPTTTAATLGTTLEAAKEFLAVYDEALPFVNTTFDKAKDRARIHGVITTVLGRKARFDLWEPKAWGEKGMLPRAAAIEKWGERKITRAMTHKALNAYTQGSNADALKRGMVDIWESGVCDVMGAPLLTVHDELDWNKPRTKAGDEAALEIKHRMEVAVKLRVPVIVDMKTGPSWGELE